VTSRVDIIGQNGGDGSHYLVEKVARVLAGKDADMKMMGKCAGKERWELFIPLAMKVIDAVEEFNNE
jgi:hypothetical protein